MDETLIKIMYRKKDGNQQCKAENTVGYGIVSFWVGNREKK